MGTVLATTLGLVIWIVLWSLGVKGIDAFFITLTITLVAVGGRMVGQFLPANRA
jgi:hypothetical protein